MGYEPNRGSSGAWAGSEDRIDESDGRYLQLQSELNGIWEGLGRCSLGFWVFT